MTRILGALSERARRFLNRRLSYRECFLQPGGAPTGAGSAVLRDLARFCHSHRTTFKTSLAGSADPLAMAYFEGRRSVFLRFQAMLELPEEEFLRSLEDESNER